MRKNSLPKASPDAASVRVFSRLPFRVGVALLLLASGGCGLVYQVTWLRTLRLVFGTTTAAAATTLAIFMGGLGVGGLLLGRRADRVARPLRLYAQLELGIATAALASLLLIALARYVYIAIGGVSTLGPLAATGLRIGLCALVLGPATFLMGGTLPAAVRALEHAADRSRRTVGLLYGVNTCGAVLGTAWATFVSLERWGSSNTLLYAGILNLFVAACAFALARRGVQGRRAPSGNRRPSKPPPSLLSGKGLSFLSPGDLTPWPPSRRGKGEPTERSSIMDPPLRVAEELGERFGGLFGEDRQSRKDAEPAAAPMWLVLAAAAAVGAAFLLMELVWYRMLAPILGGSTYTFGLILAVALLGIGAGGVLYAGGPAQRRPTLLVFTVSCLLEALCIVLPYAAGDRIALFALAAHAWAAGSFPALVMTWIAVAAFVVLPAAVVAGYQLPLLIALLGTREHNVGREVGLAYAANTAGAIAGSLAGGFGLLPFLTAPGAWRAAVYLLVGVALLSAPLVLRRTRPLPGLMLAAVLAALDIVLCMAPGPTAFWRHTAIGAGRLETLARGPNDVTQLLHRKRAAILWEKEGTESSIAIDRSDAYSLVVDGKSDGNALADAPTQVMGGLVGAILHPDVKRALVIGMGTGSTAGWLAAVPSLERVDVLELEPAVLHMVEVCAPVNQNVLANPKVHTVFGDGREFLLTTAEQYDLIFSEPSNPYRAGIASLFTREFYQAAAARLRPGGIFAQWLQGYEIQPRSAAAVYATFGAVFPYVETWEVNVGGDLLLTASMRAQAPDAALLGARVAAQPYRSALESVWGVSGVEGFYAAYAANADFAADLARDSGRINTDDHTFLEFEFARSAGQAHVFSIQGLRAVAAKRHQDRPQLAGTVDWERVEELRGLRVLNGGYVPEDPGLTEAAGRARALARHAYAVGKFPEAREHWLAQHGGAQGPMDETMLAEIFAPLGDATAQQAIEALRARQPAEAETMTARQRYLVGDKTAAAQHLARAFGMYRSEPWAHRQVFSRALQLATRIASEEPTQREALFAALTGPFPVRALDLERLSVRAVIGLGDRPGPLCAAALAPLEPHVPWDRDLLQARSDCYTFIGSPLAAQAHADLATFLANAPAGLGPAPSAPR
jgi:spermidine synthase